MSKDIDNQNNSENNPTDSHKQDIPLTRLLSGMYKNWFLDYASYVILERAVPHLNDGLKPVQRRILHSMRRMEDGRYNKVANIIGHTMQFHPHGDASIGDALTQLGQKELLIDMQGNWGNIFTGDNAAAPRYIEARLSKFALDVAFNPKTTSWKPSYDGRNKEPIQLPMKFPLLLAQGVEGIAVGLASKILPHNFIELIDASVAHLRNQPFELYPDFPTGGYCDAGRYNDGLRGGKVRVRAKIEKLDKKTLVIKDIPFGTTTTSLIDSILAANEKGKIKIRKIDDNTAEFVEILVHLGMNVTPDQTIDALYAFTDCEVSISPNSTVIEDDKPKFLGVTTMLKHSTERTRDLLKLELEIRLHELGEDWHFSSLEKIFIEKRIYRNIEECETWEAIIETIDKGLAPYKKLFYRTITTEDITKLTEIRIKRISKFDAFQADEHIKGLENEMKKVQNNIDHITDYAIKYFEEIKRKYAPGRERKTVLRSFDTIEATQVVVANQKLYVNREEGFVGTGLKKDEFVADCSDIDDIIVFRRDGKYFITKVAEKVFIGKQIIHVGIFRKSDERTIYNAIYLDGKSGVAYVKRFSVTSVTRDKEYDISKGEQHSRVLYFSANPNGEAETVKITLKPRPRLKKLQFEFDFSSIEIKGRSSIGNILSRNPIHKIVLSGAGRSTLGGHKIWFDADVHRINNDSRGKYLGEFKDDEKIVVFSNSGYYQFTSFELTNHYPSDVCFIAKYDVDQVFTAIYFDGEQNTYFVKRFAAEYSDKDTVFISEHPASKLFSILDYDDPSIEVAWGGLQSKLPAETINLTEFVPVKGAKAKGKRLSTNTVAEIKVLEPFVDEESEDEPIEINFIRYGDDGEIIESGQISEESTDEE